MSEKKEAEEKVAEGAPPEAEVGKDAAEEAGGEGAVQGGEADREEDPKGSGDPDVLFGAPEEEPEEEPKEEPEGEPADLESEVADLKDKLLRALAEMENVRRRAQRNSADASRYAIANFAREMLGVADNLRRALDSAAGPGEEDVEADADAGEGEAGDLGDRLQQLITGVEMTEREMLNAFERAGIKPIEAMGHRFDHNYHEAMFEVEDESQPTGTVIQVMQPGFMINDRLLRPAKVGVSKGGPKAEPDTDPDDKPDPAATGKAAAYEKQVDTADETTGTQLDREL